MNLKNKIILIIGVLLVSIVTVSHISTFLATYTVVDDLKLSVSNHTLKIADTVQVKISDSNTADKKVVIPIVKGVEYISSDKQKASVVVDAVNHQLVIDWLEPESEQKEITLTLKLDEPGTMKLRALTLRNEQEVSSNEVSIMVEEATEELETPVVTESTEGTTSTSDASTTEQSNETIEESTKESTPTSVESTPEEVNESSEETTEKIENNEENLTIDKAATPWYNPVFLKYGLKENFPTLPAMDKNFVADNKALIPAANSFFMSWNVVGDRIILNQSTLTRNHTIGSTKLVSYKKTERPIVKDSRSLLFKNSGVYQGEIIDTELILNDWSDSTTNNSGHVSFDQMIRNGQMRIYTPAMNYIDFTWRFYKTGTKTPANIKGYISASDIDGPSVANGAGGEFYGMTTAEAVDKKVTFYSELNAKFPASYRQSIDGKYLFIGGTNTNEQAEGALVTSTFEGNSLSLYFGQRNKSESTVPFLKTDYTEQMGNAFETSALKTRATEMSELRKYAYNVGDDPSDKNELVKATDDFYYELQQDIGMEAPSSYYKNLELTDNLPQFLETKASDIIIEELLSGDDVTKQFDVAVTGKGKVSIKAKAATLKVATFYGKTYRFKIKTHVTRDVVLEDAWDASLKKYVFKNKASIKIDTQEKMSKEVTTLVPPTEILITKLDAKTSDVLEGATYSVRDKADKEVAKVTTGKEGTAIVAGLPVGTYAVKETKAPIGYNADAPDQSVTTNHSVGNESVKSITFKNTLKEPKPNVKKEASVELTTLNETYDYTLTVSTAKDTGIWYDGVVSDIVPNGLTIVSVTDVEERKELTWNKETNTIKWSLAKETPAGTTRHAKVKVKVTDKPKENYQFINTVTASGKNKHKEVIKPKDASVTVNYKAGDIGFKEIPEKMSFNESYLSMYPSTIERQKVDWGIDIVDTRTHKEPWRVTVKQITPFETTEGEFLPDILTFRQEGKADQIVNMANTVEVYNETKLVDTNYKLSWPKKEGFFLDVQPGQAKPKQYSTELQWNLENVAL